jgi:UDP-glucose:glycoprotein glucosyltransferase
LKFCSSYYSPAQTQAHISSETVYDEQPSSYFPLLNLLASHIPSPPPPPAEILATALDLITTYTLLPKPSSLSTFNLALSLHTSVTRIEASYSWYQGEIDEELLGVGKEGCETWVEWRGKGFCGVDELRRDVEMSLEDGSHKA